MTDYNTNPEEEDLNDEDLGIDGDEEFLEFNYPMGTKLKEEDEADEDAPLDDEDLGEGEDD